MKTIYKLAIVFGILSLFVSCAKEILAPEQMITGRFAWDDGSGLSNEYIEFGAGKMSTNISGMKQTFAENCFWNTSSGAFRQDTKVTYCIMDGNLYLGGKNEGKISLDGKVLTIGNVKYGELVSFKSDFYSTISTAQKTVTVPYQQSSTEVEVLIEKPIKAGVVTAATTTSWISNLKVDGNKLTFVTSTTKSDRQGSIIIKYTNAKDYVLNVSQEPATSIVLDSETGTTDYVGKTTSFPCSIKNPLATSTLSATCNSSWVSDISFDGNNVNFKVSENTGSLDRTATFTLSYVGARDITYTLTQNWASTSIETTPVSAQIDYSRQTSSFSFVVNHPVSGATMSATSNVNWITGISVSGDKVSYTIAENNSGNNRKGIITLKYGATSSITLCQVQFEVSQSYSETTIKTTPSSASPAYTGGNASFTFSVENPRSGATMSASSNVSWITGISVSGNKVSYSVAQNNSILPRSGKITLKYSSYATHEFAIEQALHPVTSLQISKSSVSLTAGESTTLTATVVPSDAELSWNSSKESIASVDKSGKITAIAIGTTDITVASGGKSAKCTVTVNGKANNLSLSPSWTESAGLTYGNTGTITISNPYGGQLSVSSSPNSNIATAGTIVSPFARNTSVNITPVAAGETSITIKSTATAQYAETTKTLQIKILKATPSFSISPTSLNLMTNGASGQIVITSNSDCNFTASSNSTYVAQVSVSGKTVTVRPYSEGSATITINCPETSRYKSASSLQCSVKVKSTVDLSSSGTANCYVVNKAGDYEFKATVKGNSSTSVGTPASASVLWESFGTSSTPSVGAIVTNVSYSSGYVTFSTPSTLNNGNAVIAVKDASGNILWSWHIWVCKDFDPSATAQVYKNSAGTMMDRNLGATSSAKGNVGALGLLYQWGRKDPFLSGCQISYSLSSNQQQAASTLSWPSSVSSDASNGTISYAITHPTTFITDNSSNYDWYYTGSSSTDNSRWQPTKTMYDPCPPGWRVPDGGISGVWSKAFGSSSYYSSGPWDGTNRGMNFGSGNGHSSSHQLGSASTIWHPAAGYRGNGDGSLLSVGNYGSYWSCTPYSNTVYVSHFDNFGDVFTSLKYYRGDGQSVRCLQE